jgi:hypothetical protein
MQRIEVTAPKGKGEQVAQMALDLGVSQASVQQVFVHGPNQEKEVVTFQTSSPQGKQFVDSLALWDEFDPQQYSIVTQPVPGAAQSDGPMELAHPLPIPVIEVYNDFVMRTRITPGFIARAVSSSAVLAYGLIQNNFVLIVAGLMFSPYVAQVLALAFGAQAQRWQQLRQAALAVLTAIVLTFLTGVVVGLLSNTPIQFSQFSPIITNMLLSMVIGAVGALETSDTTGRLELVALAAASQFATYPAYLGLALVLPVPEGVDLSRLALIFVVNLVSFSIVAAVTYMLIKYRRAVLAKINAN